MKKAAVAETDSTTAEWACAAGVKAYAGQELLLAGFGDTRDTGGLSIGACAPIQVVTPVDRFAHTHITSRNARDRLAAGPKRVRRSLDGKVGLRGAVASMQGREKLRYLLIRRR
ncbi:hypothetical protein, partial [Mesorhizobium australicum]|uniref:hypothetical protein n=1 Tax=Mesorhizobium australicum TaxID=536018 RepID=UPI00333BAB81